MNYLRNRNKGSKNKGQPVSNRFLHSSEQPAMENKKQQKSQPKQQNKSKSSSQSPKQLGKHVLAAYYNDARRNILACLNDIRAKLGKKTIENEDQIREAFLDLGLSSTTPERQDEIIRHLRYRFHFLDLLTDAKGDVSQKNKQDNATPLPHYYESHLVWILELVNGLRNTMAHPVDDESSIPYDMHRKLYFALSQIYDSSFHTVKTRFGHETKTMDAFKRCDGKGKPQKPQKFSFALCADPTDLNKASILPQSKVLYDFGHILFCALFLEKSQSAELINYFWQTRHGDTWSNTDQRSIIREMIAVYRVRLPVQRLKSDDTATSVTMDTLSELSRCPRALLGMLSPEDQNRFRGEPGVGVNEAGENIVIDAENTYLFARSRQDRFIPLMMRFLDFNDNNRLRFAVDLGQFYYNVRLKPASQFTDGLPRVRRLSQKILAYGRLLDFEQAEKPADWVQLEENAKIARDEEEALLQSAGDSIQQLKPYVVQTYPHYHYFDDKIGFRLDDTDPEDKRLAVYPDLQGNNADQNVALNSPKGREMMPEFWMSPAQMLQLVFYSQLQQENKRYPELHNVLIRYRSGLHSLLKALQQGDVALSGAAHSAERRKAAEQWVNGHFRTKEGTVFQVTLSALPKVVIQHLLGAGERQVAVSEVIKRAEHLLDRTFTRQQRLKSQLQMADKKRGQKGFRAIKCGPIGDFIAEDLMRFQPVDGNRSDGGKINSQQYQILQKTLAYYGAHLDGKTPPNIVDLMRDARLLDGPFAHPFIGDLNLENQPNRFQGLISFYEAYLQARAAYLKNFIQEHKNRDTLNFVPHWLRLRQPSTLSRWLEGERDKDGKLKGDGQLDEAGNLLQPLPLLNNMLYPPILNMVAEALDISPAQIEDEGTQRFQRDGATVEIKPAVTWLIKRYLNGQGDAPQRMYSEYPRRHNLFDTWLDSRTKKQRFAEKPANQLLEVDRQHHMADIQQFVAAYYPSEEAEVEHIRKEMAKPRSKMAGSDVAKSIKLKSLIRGYKRDEQKVRFSVSQDMLLYLSARQYLEGLQLSDPEAEPVWSLHDLERDLLQTEINYRLAVPDTEKSLVHPVCKIRDRGELTLLVRDRRLKSLMKYYPDDEDVIHHKEIRYELNSYRRAKVAVMAMVHELENRIIAVLENVPKRDEELEKHTSRHFGKGRHGDFLYALHEYYQYSSPEQAASFDSKRFKRTLLIRNAFSHNQYPDVAKFIQIAAAVQAEAVPENPDQNRRVAERLKEEMETLYDPWLQYLKQAQDA